MKKVAVIVQSKDADSALKSLGSLGVMHIEHQQAPQGKDLSAIQDDIAGINQALAILSADELWDNSGKENHQESGDWRFLSRHIIDAHKRLDQLAEYSRSLKARISAWESWGDFDPQAINSLAQKNIFVRLYQIPRREIEDLPSGVIVKELSSSQGIVNCAVISREKLDILFKEVALPKAGLNEMRARLAKDEKTIEVIKQDIRKNACYRQSLISQRESLKKELEFQEALRGMGETGEIKYLTGYVPFDSTEALSCFAKKEKWGLVINDPAPEDNVPTLLRTPRWVRLINPVFKLLEVLPGYRELDISLPFFVFFSLFFGILIGDAGYGIIYTFLTVWAQRKFSHKMQDKSVFFLLYVLSFCAIFWGLLTGSFFGQSWCAKLGFKPILPALNDTKTMQTLCFFLGALHLSIAHSWRAILKIPCLSALTDIGWICVLWSAFFFARMLILGVPLPGFVMNLLFIGIALVILFTNPQKNMLKGIGEGLGAVALSLMNNFTDVVSYVRLFAVGMAGLAIAETVNIMAGGISGKTLFAGIARIIIIVIGHGLNIVLGPMSVLVHGVRLNVLEFSGHANVTWSGLAYKPLRK
ncbi:MAG: hypothetical protein Q8O13_01060 [Candidatus Omnitrophota bacterium]|nr:hypothetical protein [Candidatus Omnitrophota bacterium]